MSAARVTQPGGRSREILAIAGFSGAEIDRPMESGAVRAPHGRME
jgi:hypothetical protein